MGHRQRFYHQKFFCDRQQMSASLPSFEAGQPLRADALNALAARIRELQARQPSSGGGISHARRVIPCRHYAFELASLNGMMYYRQGWIDTGTGIPQPVGAQEWNVLEKLRPCTVWLEFSGTSPDDCSAQVVVGEYDESSPETNFKRRLGYVRADELDDGTRVPTIYCVQVAGGLMTPIAPRRAMGCPSLVEPARFCKFDHSLTACYAGAIYGDGQRNDAMQLDTVRRVSFGYAMDMYTNFYATHGHRQAGQCLSFYTPW